MTDILRRSQAPIGAEAWKAIDEEARAQLKTWLSARYLVDFDGPHGWDFSSVNLGRLDLKKKDARDGVAWGVRQSLPLIEIRVPFSLNQMELDSIARGAADPDFDPIREAARKLAAFEDEAVFDGFKDAGIKGVIETSPHEPLKLSKEMTELPGLVSEARKRMLGAGVGGPFTLVLGVEAGEALDRAVSCGYPVRKTIHNLLDNEIVHSPNLKGGLLISRRGGDYTLTVGQDISIGYAGHDRDSVELYFTESLTFRVLEPAAAVYLKPAK